MEEKELCGYGCGRKWDAEGDFDDCPSAYHENPMNKTNQDWEKNLKNGMIGEYAEFVMDGDNTQKYEKIAKEIIGKWGYEESYWWKPISDALQTEKEKMKKELVEWSIRKIDNDLRIYGTDKHGISLEDLINKIKTL